MPLVFILPLTICATPRAIIIVPRVAMNAGSFATEIRSPFTRPIARQQIIVMSTVKIGFILNFVISVALIMHDIPATEPIERSIPAVMRTND